MGCFSQKGLCYSFEILQGLLSNKNIKIPMKKIFGGSPLYPQLTLFLPENGEIWWNWLCRHGRQIISTSANGGLSGGLMCVDTGEKPLLALVEIFKSVALSENLKGIPCCLLNLLLITKIFKGYLNTGPQINTETQYSRTKLHRAFTRKLK